MFIDDLSFTRGKKTYRRVLLRNSYRVQGQVRHDTLGNLSTCSGEEIEAIKLALKYKGDLAALTKVATNVKTKQGLAVGGVWVLKELAKRIGIVRALGSSRQAKLSLWLAIAAVLEQGSRLSAVRLAQRHAVCDILGLDSFNEDDLYLAMDWLDERQAVVEQNLFRQHYKDQKPQLYLYDVTSSYLEGLKNELGDWGYNRDGKKGKKQIVIGMLTDEDGWPISVQVFRGNTQDTTTFRDQVEKMAGRFGVKEVTMVGDRGMIRGVQITDLAKENFHYITAITKPQIEKMLKEGLIQMNLFEDRLAEIFMGKLRYVLRRNPERAAEMAKTRMSKMSKLREHAEKQTSYLANHPHAKVQVAVKKVEQKAEKMKVREWIVLRSEGRKLVIETNEEKMTEAAKLDGCYVIKSDLLAQQASAEIVHARYKDLAEVEWAFRTLKTTFLEMRGIYVRVAARTRAHVFIKMLAYLLAYTLRRLWRDVELTIEEGVAELASIGSIEVVLGEKTSYQTIPEPRENGKVLLQKAAITLPDAIPCRNVKVVTRKKLVPERRTP